MIKRHVINIDPDQSIRPFTRILRADGFTLDYRDRSKINGTTTEYKCCRGNRTVRVQFFSTGGHRITHGTHHPIHHERYWECTPPTIFSTIPEMLTILAKEWTRPGTPYANNIGIIHGNPPPIGKCKCCGRFDGIPMPIRWELIPQ